MDQIRKFGEQTSRVLEIQVRRAGIRGVFRIVEG